MTTKRNIDADSADIGRHGNVLTAYGAHPGPQPEPPPSLDAHVLLRAQAALASRSTSANNASITHVEPRLGSASRTARRRTKRWPLAFAASVASIGFAALVARQHFATETPTYPAASYPQPSAAPATPVIASSAPSGGPMPEVAAPAVTVAADMPAPLPDAAPPAAATAPSVVASNAPVALAQDNAQAAEAKQELAADIESVFPASPQESPTAPPRDVSAPPADSLDKYAADPEQLRGMLKRSAEAPEQITEPVRARESVSTYESAAAPVSAMPAPMPAADARQDSAEENALSGTGADAAVAAQPQTEPQEQENSGALPPTPARRAAPAKQSTNGLPSGATAPEPHAKVFKAIRALLASGEREKAKAMLVRLLKAYPDAILPPDLAELSPR
jgi:hypothetical protein